MYNFFSYMSNNAKLYKSIEETINNYMTLVIVHVQRTCDASISSVLPNLRTYYLSCINKYNINGAS
jgi:hypothetical protein